MLRTPILLVFAFAACGGGPATGTTTGTTTPPPTTDTTEPEPPVVVETADTAIETADTGEPPAIGPLAVTWASVACIDDFTVEFTVETQGLSYDGVAYEQETGNYPPAQWSDSLPLESFEHDPAGAWDHLRHELEHVDSIADFQPGVNTLFGCQAHYDPGADVMSYAVGVYDATGAVADCVAWGENPQGMMAGTAGNAVNAPMWDITACRIGAYAW